MFTVESQGKTETVEQNLALDQFRYSCFRYYTCYSCSSLGIRQTYKEFKSLWDASPKGIPDHMEEFFDQYEKGDNEELIARAFVVSIFTEWEEVWRPRIAKDYGIQPNDVECDLLGDLRKIRNLIIHNTWKPELKVLDWTVDPKAFRVSDDMFRKLIDQIDEMQLRLKINH